MLIYWMVLQIFGGSLPQSVAEEGGGVAFWAHIGGFVAGAVLVLATPQSPLARAPPVLRLATAARRRGAGTRRATENDASNPRPSRISRTATYLPAGVAAGGMNDTSLRDWINHRPSTFTSTSS